MTSFVRIESKSIAPSVRRCTSPNPLIDLMEPTLAHHLPTFSSRATRRALSYLLKFTFTSHSFSAFIWLVPGDPSSSSQRKAQLLTRRSGKSALTRRCTQVLDLRAPNKGQAQRNRLPILSSNSVRRVTGQARVGTVGRRIETNNTIQRTNDYCRSEQSCVDATYFSQRGVSSLVLLAVPLTI